MSVKPVPQQQQQKSSQSRSLLPPTFQGTPASRVGVGHTGIPSRTISYFSVQGPRATVDFVTQPMPQQAEAASISLRKVQGCTWLPGSLKEHLLLSHLPFLSLLERDYGFGRVTHHVHSLFTGPVCPMSVHPACRLSLLCAMSSVLSSLHRTVFSSQQAILEAASKNFPFSF